MASPLNCQMANEQNINGITTAPDEGVEVMATQSVPQKIDDPNAAPNVDTRVTANQSAQEWEEIVREYSTAAQDGDTETLYSLIERHPHALKLIEKTQFAETPLHVAASAGNVSVASELMILEPALARKLNKKGFTPLHLALQEKHKLELGSSGQRNEDPEMQEIPGANGTLEKRVVKVVRLLIEFDKDLVKVKGKESLTPLHCAARLGNIEIMILFLNKCPTSILELTNQMESALHIALKHEKHQAFLLLVQWLHRGQGPEVNLKRRKLLSLKDEEGKTIDGIADMKVFSPVDYRHIDEELTQKSTPRTFADQVKEETRGSLLVVATLLVTLSFQAIYSPPGGTWQGDSSCPANNTSSCLAIPSHRTGTTVMGRGPFLALIGFNVLSCCSLFYLVLSLLPYDLYNVGWLASLSGSIASFTLSVIVTYPSSEGLSLKFVFPVLGVLLAALLCYFILIHRWPFSVSTLTGFLKRRWKRLLQK